ncbi:hypothetical protein [Acaryochloris sp. CCMEE 5410]|uniref:hypothetical protein n=1 Tax=Acaryochloris sp. CCMEE 5410 TaxID=310037 RepID=UPI0037C184E3
MKRTERMLLYWQIQFKEFYASSAITTTQRCSKLFEAQHRIQVAQETQASELDLSGLSLTQVPIAIMQLTKLQSLNLSGNKMSSLPPEILWLTKLQSLTCRVTN